jgi:hypothetical protein
MLAGTSEILLSLRSIMLRAGNMTFNLKEAAPDAAEAVDSVSSSEMLLNESESPKQ